MTFIKKGVVIPLGSAGEIDDKETHTMSIIRKNNKFYSYYQAYCGAKHRIALAVSEDGMNFVKKGVVIPLGSAGEIDDVYTASPSVIEKNDKIYCYYSGSDGTKYRKALAISKDGMNFVKKGVIIPLGAPGEIDDNGVAYGHVLIFNNKFYFYYEARDGTNSRIALAVSEDGMNFVKKGVVIPLGAPGEIDDVEASNPFVIKVNDKFYCYYTAYDGANHRIALAISEDGM